MHILGTPFVDSATILLLINDPKDRRVVSKALAATGCTVRVASSLQEAIDTIRSEEIHIDLLVADYDQPETTLVGYDSFDDFLAGCSQRTASHWVNGNTKILLIADKRDKAEMHNLFKLSFMTNLIAKSDNLNLDELIITVGKIIRNDIFGLEKYLCYGVSPVAYEVHSSNEKNHLLQALAGYAESLGVNKRIVTVATGVADEILTNSIYNAPIYENGIRPYARRSRTVPVDLKKNEYCYFAFASDGKQLVISARDPFGSLTAEKVRSYLVRCFNMGSDQIEHKQGGAGMGLYFIIESLNKLIINISPGRGTEIIGIIDISGTYREYAERSKSFHIFVG